jgi:hypothetical protein
VYPPVVVAPLGFGHRGTTVGPDRFDLAVQVQVVRPLLLRRSTRAPGLLPLSASAAFPEHSDSFACVSSAAEICLEEGGAVPRGEGDEVAALARCWLGA